MPPPLPPRDPKDPSSSKENLKRMQSSPGELGHQHDGVTDEDNVAVISPRSLLDETAETTIGKNVIINGQLRFDRLVRIDGSFSGQLISQGNLVIGSDGKLEGNVEGMRSVLVDGKVVGNIRADTVCLRNQATVFGDITCQSITVDPEVTIVGRVNINPQAPKLFDVEGNEMM